MTFRDDEDLFISSSGQDSLESRAKAERKAREEKARKKGDLLNLQKNILRGQVDAAKANEETKRMQKQSNDDSKTFGTKTLKEAEDEDMLSGDSEFTTDDLVKESHKETKRKQQQSSEIQNDKA